MTDWDDGCVRGVIELRMALLKLLAKRAQCGHGLGVVFVMLDDKSEVCDYLPDQEGLKSLFVGDRPHYFVELLIKRRPLELLREIDPLLKPLLGELLPLLPPSDGRPFQSQALSLSGQACSTPC